jgi:hypothetical protein
MRALAALLCASTATLGFAPAAGAGIVTTQQYLELESQGAAGDGLGEWLASDPVRQQLLRLGVAPEVVEARIAALTPEERDALAERIDSLPAGGDALALIGAVFLVLLILEIVGVIDIFKRA